MRDLCAASSGWRSVRAPLAAGCGMSLSCPIPGLGCTVAISAASGLPPPAPSSSSSSSSSSSDNSASAICSGAAENGIVSGILIEEHSARMRKWINHD